MQLIRSFLLGALLASGGQAALAAAPVTHGTCRSGNVGFFKDEGLAIKVSTKLQFTKALMREKIEVKSNAGVVSLSGNVSTLDHVSLAGRIASQVEGVVCVNNFLKVGPQEPPRYPSGPG
mgnify:CR=1 FL=1